MAVKVFVSFSINERSVSQKVAAKLKELEQHLDVHWVWMENDVSYNGDTAIAWELEQLMSDCCVALFILGDNPRTSPWLDMEANQAIARELPLIVTHLPDTQPILPDFVSRVAFHTADWQSEAIAKVIEQALKYPV